MKEQGNVSFPSVKRLKRANRCILWLRKNQENVLVLLFIHFLTTVHLQQLKGLPFDNRGIQIKGYFLSKMVYLTIFLKPGWALSQQPMRPKAEWAVDSEAMRERRIIVLVKSNQLVKNNETKHLQLAKCDSAAIVLIFKAGAFRYQRAITYSLVVAQPIRTQHWISLKRVKGSNLRSKPPRIKLFLSTLAPRQLFCSTAA